MEVTTHRPGTFCWVDLNTTDPVAAKRFYSELFGWKTEDLPTPAGPYTMLRIGNDDVAALSALSAEMKKAGARPSWTSYVLVKDLEETTRKVTGAGGKVVMPPMEVMDVGRMAMIQDPTGATLALWQAKKHAGAKRVNEPGALCWNELNTRDLGKAGKFYETVFGWKQKLSETPVKYVEFQAQEKSIAGMMELGKELAGVSPHWQVYFEVKDIDASAQRIKSLGGKILVEPRDIPKVGRFAVAQDPQGAVFSLLKMAQ
ncbi:MAG: VOC family protein [Myxococcota bacterium]